VKALILAAGYATRLYPLTKEDPKPLLSVDDRPIIDYIMDKLEAAGRIDEIFVVTNSKFFPKFKEWRAKRKNKKRVTLVDDLTKDLETRRGAIGDMSFAIEKKRIKSDLLVIGGDNLFEGGLDGFLSFAASKGHYPVIGVYDIKKRSEATKYGVIKLKKSKRVSDFQEKPGLPKSTLVAMCLYYFPGESLSLLKEYIEDCASGRDATGFYINWLRKKTPVYGYVFSGRWFDIGDHKFYNLAREKFRKQ
jgi:glucose-1-phosphate thymidylyltransferase